MCAVRAIVTRALRPLPTANSASSHYQPVRVLVYSVTYQLASRAAATELLTAVLSVHSAVRYCVADIGFDVRLTCHATLILCSDSTSSRTV